jgi:nitrogen fixation/metabolism regulation signal transduction histidine kinase
MPGRFEWKILGAMLLVAVLSVATAGYALKFALNHFLNVWKIDRQTADAAGRAAKVFEAYFASRKEEFKRRTEALAAARPERMADLEGVEGLLRARLLDDHERVLNAWEARPEAYLRAREGPPNIAVIPGADPVRVLELTFGIPSELYEKFLELRAALQEERERGQVYDALVGPMLREYFIVVVALIALVPFAGLYFARRATRRVALLQEAARKVGEGDLTVQVAPTGRDELDELGRAFDLMVRELADARSRLEYLQKVAAWQEVARRLAHEIKNPLTPIQLAVQELASKYRGDDPQYRRLLDTALEILTEEITSLRRLVEDFSAFAKLPKVSLEPVDLGAMVGEFGRLHPTFQPHMQPGPEGAPVMAPCDRMLFGRVLTNLVENAVQAAEASGRQPQVRLSVEARPLRQRAAIIVDDNGPGVTPGDRHRIFDPYYTSKPNGTGLGLAIVRKIVIDHGGDVAIDAAPSPLGGARFVVEIPT